MEKKKVAKAKPVRGMKKGGPTSLDQKKYGWNMSGVINQRRSGSRGK